MKRNEIIGEIKANPDYLRAAERSLSQARDAQRTFGKSPEEKAAARRKEINRDKGIAGYSKRYNKENPRPKVEPRGDSKGASGPQDWYGQNRYMGDSVEQGVAEGLNDTQKKIEDTILKLEQRLKFAKTPEQWDNIKDRIERLQAGLNRSKQGVAESGEHRVWVVQYWDKQPGNDSAQQEFTSKPAADKFAQTLPRHYAVAVRPQSKDTRPDMGESVAEGMSRDEYNQIQYAIDNFKDEYGEEPSGPDIFNIADSLGVEPDSVINVLYGRVVPDHGQAEGSINELSKSTLKAYSKAAGYDVHAGQRDSNQAYSMSGKAGARGDAKKAADWDDEGMRLAKRAEKRAGGIAKATTKIAKQGVAEGSDEEDLANEVYAEFERTYPNLARRADERTIHAAIIDVLNYGGDSNPGALAQDVARAVKSNMQQRVEGAGSNTIAETIKSSLNELSGYGSDNKYKNSGTYKRYSVFVSKQKFNNLHYIAVAENPRTLDAKFKAKGKSADEALNKLKDEIDKEIDVATKVSGQAILDFNVDFVKDILEMSSSVFYAKIVAGPKLVIAGPEMMEYPEIMQDEGFKASAIRTYKGGEGTTKLPGVPLSAKAASSLNLIANGRYILGNETIDKNGNRVFNLEFDSVVQAQNDKMRLRAPAVTVGTKRFQDVSKGLNEDVRDYVGDAIEGLKMAKPGLEREDFLDELYIYIDAEMGKRAADAAFEDQDSYDDWYESYAESMDENANMLKVTKDDDQQTILQNPSTGVKTQIDKKNPNAPSLVKDQTTGKLKLSTPVQGSKTALKPNLVGKDVEVATESANITSMLRLAGLR
jgi:hypothetical protein